MEADSELEFEHFLAEKLSMTVTELRQRMPQAEFIRWHVYYGRKAQQAQLRAAQAQAQRR